MLDGKYKKEMDAFWDKLGILFVKAHLSANAVTWLGLALVIISCLIFWLTRNTWLFCIMLGISFTADALDGSVARLTGTSSRYGAYLDAVIDRYQEMIVFLTIAVVNNSWNVCFWAFSGSLLISYNKARAGMEAPISNTAWPDFLERTERIFLIIGGVLAEAMWPGRNLLRHTVLLIAVLAHFTAIQRFLRAKRIIEAYENI